MAVLGIGLGAVQLIPLVELLPLNFRAGSASLEQVRGWAWPSRHVLTFWLPNIFGSPSHHQWFDLWTRAVGAGHGQRAGRGQPHDLLGHQELRRRRQLPGGGHVAAGGSRRVARGQCGDAAGWPGRRPFLYWLFAGLAVVSLLFAFGTPLYALLYYGLPGWNQLHSPFRWVFPFTLSMAMLGGSG